MSIYCYLSCKKCKESLFVKDADTSVHADPNVLGQFLEKHYCHELIYTWEDDEPENWPAFEMPQNGWWSCGKYYEHKAIKNTHPRACTDPEIPTNLFGWTPFSEQRPPLTEETPETNGFFLLLRHNPSRDAAGQYRMHLWFGSVPIDSTHWARIPSLPNAKAEPSGRE